MNLKKLCLLYIAICLSAFTFAQDTSYTRSIIKILASEDFSGRAYVNKGDKLAANFIKEQLEEIGVQAINDSYYQKVNFPINTFPGEMELTLDGILLDPVDEYLISPNSPSISGRYSITYLPEAADTIDYLFDSISKIDYGKQFIVAPFKNRKISRNNPFKAAGVLVPQKHMYWWASTALEVVETPLFIIQDSILECKPKTVSVNAKNKFYSNYSSQNVIGLIPGTEKADSFMVFSAHYDHLGTMGKGNIFRGANDNASGTAMLLNIAKHYSKPENKPKYSIAFLFFTGEEAGLLGSRYYALNPTINLSKVKALINLDMVGSGSDGIALVNGKNTPWITQRIQSINEEKSYFSDIKVRGESCNSDHCFFHKAGVPSIFIYTRGKEHTAYHTLHDIPELPLTKFSELFNLLIEVSE